MLSPRSVYIAFEVFPRPKGASSHMASMVRALAGDHGPVLLLCLGFGDMPAFQTEGDIFIRRCKMYHPNLLKRAHLFAGFVADHLDIWRETLELCVFRDPWGGMPAVLTAPHLKTLFEVNALPSWELGYTYPAFDRNPGLKHKIMDMEQSCLDRCDRILTVSGVTARALMGKGVPAEKITTVWNCAPESFFGPHVEKDDTLRAGRRIGYVGSLHSWQGVDDAVSAFALIRPRYPDLTLRVITGGRKEDRKKIRKEIRKLGLEDHIRLDHPMPRHELIHELRSFEFTLAPLRDTPRNTYQGCCPVKIIESMAAGVPVLASNLEPVRALIDHGQDGWLVEPGSVRHLALGMDALLRNRSLSRSLGAHAAKRARDDFHPEHIHRALIRCFHETIQSKGVHSGSGGYSGPGRAAAGSCGGGHEQAGFGQKEAATMD